MSAHQSIQSSNQCGKTKMCFRIFTLVAFIALAYVITSVQADYSYAEGTPGTQWGGAGAVAAGASPLLASRKFHPIGLTYAGVAAGGGAVLNTNQFDCGAIITGISTALTALNPLVVPAPPAALGPGADAAAILLHQQSTATYDQARIVYQAALHSTAYQAQRQMAQDVIGVAVVDYGTAAAPDIRAFLSRSGSSAPFNEQEALNYAAALQPGGSPLQNVGSWHFIDTTTDDVLHVKNYRSTRLVDLPAATGAEGTDITAWGASAAAPPANSEDIYFAVGPVRVAKKWRTGPHAAWQVDSTAHRTTCAMQKLMYTLFGMGPGANIPGGGQRLRSDAHRQADGAGRARLVCAAEAAHAPAGINVRRWDNVNQNYPVSTLVPSCTMCQSIVPEIIDGSLSPIDCAAVGAHGVANGLPNTCGNPIAHGHSCQVTCDPNFYPSLQESKCSFGVLTQQQCVAACTVSNGGGHVPSLNGAAVANAAPAAVGVTPDHLHTAGGALPICRDRLKPGHSCKVACPPLTTTPQPTAAPPVVCTAAGVLAFPQGLPTCEPDCNTPAHGTEQPHVAGRVTNPAISPCRATLKFGISCSPTCQLPAVALTNSRCGANGVLTTQATCGVPVVPVVPHHMLVQTDSESTHVESESPGRIASAKLKHHRQPQVLQP